MSDRTFWKDREVEYPRRIEITDSEGNKEIVNYEPKPGIVEEQGTPVNAFNLNKIEEKLIGLKSIDIGNVKDLTATLGDKMATIKWSDPVDLKVSDSESQEITLSTWEGTLLVRKEGSYPTSPADGKVVVDSTTRDEYKTDGFEDTELSNYIEYFYMAFPYTTEGNIIHNEANRTSVTPTPFTEDWEIGVTDFMALNEFEEVQLRWTNPDDGEFKGVMIRRDESSFPDEVTAGVLVYDGTDEEYVDSELVNDKDYYYTIWAYSDANEFSNSDNLRSIKATPTDQKIYGFEIDESNSNPDTAVAYTDDAIGFTPAKGNNGSFAWGSWEMFVKHELKIRPCVVTNPTGKVKYYLDYDNYAKKEDGIVASNLIGTDGDVMIEFGKDVYWKMTRSGTKLKCQVSNKFFTGAVKHAHEIEEGYNQFPYFLMMLTQILFTLIFKGRDSQSLLGRGYVDGNSGAINTGGANAKGFMYGESTGKQQMKFLGIEDYYGNLRQWIDGCFYDSNRNIKIGKSEFNDSGVGYIDYGQASTANLSGYISKVQGGNETGFIPKETSGSATTHYADNGDLTPDRMSSFGGNHNYADNAGAFYLHSDSTSYSSTHLGSRLCGKFNGKLYLGVYLGFEQASKLRSVSGKAPTVAKTIGQFRTLAQNNNA